MPVNRIVGLIANTTTRLLTLHHTACVTSWHLDLNFQTHSHVSYIFRSVPKSQQQVQSSVSGLGHYWGLGPRGLIHHSCFCLVLWITVGLLFCTLCILSCPQGGRADDGRTSQGICGKHTASHPVRVSLPDGTALTQKLWRTHSARLAVVRGTESSARGASHIPIPRLIYVYHWYCFF